MESNAFTAKEPEDVDTEFDPGANDKKLEPFVIITLLAEMRLAALMMGLVKLPMVVLLQNNVPIVAVPEIVLDVTLD